MKKNKNYKIREYEIIKTDFIKSCEPTYTYIKDEAEFKVIDVIVSTLFALAIISAVSVLVLQIIKFYN
jgi:hypothetical protein